MNSAKNDSELDYWKKIKDKEGVFYNSWYQWYYTDLYNLNLNFYKDKTVLDIGCGPRGSLAWATNAKRRVGLDPLAQRYIELGADTSKMEYITGKSEKIPFSNASFDIITSINSLDHVDDLSQTLTEIDRVLKPGGVLLIVVDIHHKPTPCEPIVIPWNFVEKSFDLDVYSIDILRKIERTDNLNSARLNIPYDFEDRSERYGMIVAKLRKKDNQILYQNFDCSICGGKFKSFLDFNGRKNAQCPKCNSLERHRFIYSYIIERNLITARDARDKFKLLHFAPQTNLYKKFFSNPLVEYTDVDYFAKGYTYEHTTQHADIRSLQFNADKFDGIICSHVLEHIPEDDQAIAELYRVLNKSGWCLIMVPTNINRLETIEEDQPLTPKQRKDHWGQHDHVRLYGYESLKWKLYKTGFNCTLIFASDFQNKQRKESFGLNKHDIIFYCTKA